MRTFTLLISAGLMTLGGIMLAQAQGNPVQGSPGSAFPHAARHEVQMIGGVPCRTVLVKGTHTRVPVECAGQATTGTFDPNVAGGIHVEAASASVMSHSPFPHAARHELQVINGAVCRTILVKGTNTRVPVECAH